MPIRIISVTIITLFAIIISYVLTIGLTNEQLKEKPLTGWRKSLKHVLRFFGRAIAFCFGFHKIKKNGIRATRDEVNPSLNIYN
jgi:lysophosphatidylcholine acyltransferase/lyso-PAF acetyltransferase